jgi:hypothetical protein
MTEIFRRVGTAPESGDLSVSNHIRIVAVTTHNARNSDA